MKPSQVKAGLDSIAKTIATERQHVTNAKARITSAKNTLTALSTQYATLIAAVDAYTPTGAFETLAKDELALLTAEFQALKTAVTSAETSLSTETEF